MRILFVWTGITSYMAECWRALARRPDIKLKVLIEAHPNEPFDAARLFEGVDCSITRPGVLPEDVFGFAPDVVFAVGWHSKVVRRLVTDARLAGVPKVCCFDLPWRFLPRCLAARFVLGPFLRHYTAAYVPGAACARYARWLGFKRIERGLFSINVSRFSAARDNTNRSGFLYMGRFSPEKRVADIFAAYARYRELGGTWCLDAYGAGDPPENAGLARVHAFVQPAELPAIYAAHACLVLASSFDPWPLVGIEALASGCEVLASDRCMNRLELPMHVVRCGDREAMAQALLRIERTTVRPQPQPLDFWDVETWATRTERLAVELGERAK